MTPYQVEKRLIEAKVQDVSVTYGVGDLIVDLEKVYLGNYKNDSTSSEGGEVGFYSSTGGGANGGKPRKFKKQFKGTCRSCGKRGHMAKDCYANKKNQGDEAKKKDMVCWFCRKKGHKKSKCCSRLKEQGNAAADGELAFMEWHDADDSSNWCQATEPEEPEEYAFMAVDGGDSLVGEST